MSDGYEKYYLTTASGERVYVPDSVYFDYRKSMRHEKYLAEKDQKNGLQSLEQMAESSIFREPGIIDGSAQVEDIVFQHFYLELLYGYLASLSEEQRRFLSLLFEERLTLTAASSAMGWSRKKGQYWKNRLLNQLRESFRQDGITEYSL